MNIVNEVFDTVSTLALEDWGMALVEQTENSPEIFPGREKQYVGVTHFKGVMNGTIGVLCERSFMENLCRNLLGLDYDEEVTEENCKDAITELINVFCGNFLTEAYGEDTVFELVFPVVKEASREDVQQFFENRLVQCFLADDEPVAMSLGTFGIDMPDEQ